MSTIVAQPEQLDANVSAWARLQFDSDAPLTDRLFLRLCRANPDLRLERTASGELIFMPPAGADSGGRNLKIAQRLGNWVESSGHGVAFDSSAGFTLPNGAIRSPDASWILRSRWDKLSAREKKGFAPLCPDFVVELRSPGDRIEDLRAKMREYRSQSAQLGWLIDPLRHRVEIYRPGRRVRVLMSASQLSGEDVLPGFVLDLKGILFD